MIVVAAVQLAVEAEIGGSAAGVDVAARVLLHFLLI